MAIVINVQGNTNDLLGKLYGAGKGIKGLENDVVMSSNKMRGMLFQLNFAAQDFSQVFMQGGQNAFGRAIMGAANNVAMLGAAGGPLAMFGTTLLSIGLNFVSAYNGHIEKLAAKAREEAEKLRRQLNEFEVSALRFSQSLRGAGSDQSLGLARSRREEVEIMQLQLQQERANRDQIAESMIAKEKEGLSSRVFNRDLNRDFGDREALFDKDGKPMFRLQSHAEDSNEEFIKSMREVETIQQRINLARKQIAEAEKQAVNAKKQEQELADRRAADEIRNKNLTPEQMYRNSYLRASRQFGLGNLSEAEFGLEQARINKAYLKALGGTSSSASVGALERGSREFTEALLRSKMPDEQKSLQVQTVDKLRSIHEEARKMVNELRRQKSGGGNNLAVAQF